MKVATKALNLAAELLSRTLGLGWAEELTRAASP
jgi:hypothetical protein